MTSQQVDPSRAAELRRAIGRADSKAVVEGLRRCADRFSNGAWLDGDSPLLTKPHKFLKSASREELAENRENLADFAAASSLLHCADAWTLLGNATLCLLSGHLSQAIHLIYYSELRSALSLMSSTGVLVVNDVGVAVGNDSVTPTRMGASHEVLWQVFAEWSSSQQAQDLIGATLTFHKIPMTRWASIAQKGGTGAPAVAQLLQRWGVDLQNVTSDKVARNLASYNPSHLHEVRGADFGQWARDLACLLTSYLEPAHNGGFPSLDNALFSTVLTSLVGNSKDQTRRILIDVYGDRYNADRVLDLIVDLRSAGPTLIDRATRASESEAVTLETAESMMGRALILARLATGLASRIQSRAGTELGQFAWWSDEIAVRQGFWTPPNRPDPLSDLWADLELGVSDLNDVTFQHPAGPFEMHQNGAFGMVTATGLARVAVWSLSA